MDTAAYIESGILDEYVLGLLDDEGSREVIAVCDKHAAIKAALALNENALLLRATSLAQSPPALLQNQIWETLENLNKENAININDLPLINAHTNYKNWLGLVQPFIPKQVTEDRVMHVLRDTPKVIQLLVVSKTDFEDETHDDLMESFILLEGECECTVGDQVYRVGKGGYTSIPLHLPHTVRIVSPYVIAIMQRVAV